MQQQGFEVIEIRKTKKIHMEQRNGEYLLSINFKELNEKNKFQTVLIGTYSIAYNMIIVNTRIVDMVTGLVYTTSLVEIPMGKNIRYLLNNSTEFVDNNEKAYLLYGTNNQIKEYNVNVFERRLSPR